jgi:predicted RNase H-like HicB family nuclease
MTHYVALIHKEPDSDYGIMFPDFPGCVSAGADFDDALRQGVEALAGHAGLMRRDGEPIPPPRSLEEIRAAAEDWIEWEGAMVAMVPLLPAPGRAVRINVTLDERLVAQIDAVASNRSAFLAEAARKALGVAGAG